MTMKTYVGKKRIEAEPADNDAGEPGYKIITTVESWAPKDTFEDNYEEEPTP